MMQNQQRFNACHDRLVVIGNNNNNIVAVVVFRGFDSHCDLTPT
jgi:uncharacterized DUF497 family protein